jgi:hypothetical protein
MQLELAAIEQVIRALLYYTGLRVTRSARWGRVASPS